MFAAVSRMSCLFLHFHVEQEIRQFLYRHGAVRDFVLHVVTKFGESPVIAVRLEDWVVTEASRPVPLCRDGTLHDAFKEIFLVVEDECD